MGPNRYSFSDPSDVKIIYELGGKFIKSEFYHPLMATNPDDQNIFAIRDPEMHKGRRRKIANLYSMSTMLSYESAVERMNKLCLSKLTDFASKSRKFSLPEFLQWYAFDVIGDITVRIDVSYSLARDLRAAVQPVIPIYGEWWRFYRNAQDYACGQQLLGLHGNHS